MKPPTDRCRRCRWWRERYAKAWCSHPSPEFAVGDAGHVCHVFQRAARDDWAGLVYGNTDTRDTHC